MTNSDGKSLLKISKKPTCCENIYVVKSPTNQVEVGKVVIENGAFKKIYHVYDLQGNELFNLVKSSFCPCFQPSVGLYNDLTSDKIAAVESSNIEFYRYFNSDIVSKVMAVAVCLINKID